MKANPKRAGLALVLLAGLTVPVLAGAARQPILDGYAADAKAADAAFAGFSAGRGETLFRTKFAAGDAETPACTSRHTDNPDGTGRTRAGKDIAPMAVSKTPDRYTDREKVEKWFGRNCKSVLGRECSALEKGDFITFMATK